MRPHVFRLCSCSLQPRTPAGICRAAASRAASRTKQDQRPRGRLRHFPRVMTGRPRPFGVPRRTQSLCPRCNADAVSAVLNGFANVTDFRSDPGVIDAHIVEESGRIVMRKTCAKHGTFEDVLSTNPAFFKRMESLYFGHDFACAGQTNVHDHGPSTVRTGRGIALIVDLTNRCNLKCSPCFMDANHTHVRPRALDGRRPADLRSSAHA